LTPTITTQPNEPGAPIHDRMPVILDPADYARWLGEKEASQEQLLGLLRAAPARVWSVMRSEGGGERG
jgi:putative SOS response-associated peptidase YedK